MAWPSNRDAHRGKLPVTPCQQRTGARCAPPCGRNPRIFLAYPKDYIPAAGNQQGGHWRINSQLNAVTASGGARSRSSGDRRKSAGATPKVLTAIRGSHRIFAKRRVGEVWPPDSRITPNRQGGRGRTSARAASPLPTACPARARRETAPCRRKAPRPASRRDRRDGSRSAPRAASRA